LLLLVPAPLCELAFSFSSFSFPSLLNKQRTSGNENGDNVRQHVFERLLVGVDLLPFQSGR